MSDFCLKVQRFSERWMTARKRRLLLKKERQSKKNPVIDWIEAFLWAACVVLLINQYLFQAYQIPSGSMMNTLLIKDRIFVNKLIFGPELLPGIAKLPGPDTPERAEVIIFENPAYLSKGPAFDVIQRVLYMLTLSLVDIDKDQYGNPRAHFLIKRAVGMPGDRLRFDDGFLEVRPEGFSDFIAEKDFQKLGGYTYKTRRLIKEGDYRIIKANAVKDAYEMAGIPVPSEVTALAGGGDGGMDAYAKMRYRSETLYSIYPYDRKYGSDYQKLSLGWYIPEGYIFPLGDNRDDSKDARYFGPVRLKKVLGKAMFKYWPLQRLGTIR
jgi:signal peptidase I